jgi:hypothetical protein
VAQLGVGTGSSFKQGIIDTRQTWRNATPAAPDSDTRLDSEALNDLATAIVDMQEIIGARANGTYGSIAARLNQFIPGAGPVPGTISFTNTTAFTVPGVMHNLGDPAVLWQLYNAAIPAAAVQSGQGTLTLNQTNYDLTVTFSVPQSGSLALSDASPQYRATFTNQSVWTVPGATHGLGTADLQWGLFATGDPAPAIEAGSFTVHPTSQDVVVTFAAPTSGTLLLALPGPAYTATFTGQTSITILGATHGLGSAALLYRCYDTGTPRAWFEPGSFTVHPTTYDVVVQFGVPLSGRVCLGVAQTATGTDFSIQDGGIVDSTAVRMLSYLGNLYLQPGSGNHLYVRNRTGTVVTLDLDTVQQRLGLGVFPPAYQLHLSQDSAAKPGSNVWQVACDVRLKTVLGAYGDGLALVQAIQPVRYKYNGQGGMPADNKERIGVIAQDVQPIAPYMVSSYLGELTPGGGYTDILSYDGHALTFALVNAVKTLAADRDALQARVAALETQLATLTGGG